MRIEANGININYRIDGREGAPWIVLSNSLATSLAMWDEQAAALQNSYRVLRYDQRGHGGTDAPAGRYAFDTLLADETGKPSLDGLGTAGETQQHVAGVRKPPVRVEQQAFLERGQWPHFGQR